MVLRVRDERAARLLAVLALVLGLLAMHGVGAHHAAAAAPAHDRVAAAAAHHAPAPAPPAHDANVSPPAGPSCDEECPSAVGLCLAVLVGIALALLLHRRRNAPLLVAPVAPGAGAVAPPVRHARGPDPVRELCVSRT